MVKGSHIKYHSWNQALNITLKFNLEILSVKVPICWKSQTLHWVKYFNLMA